MGWFVISLMLIVYTIACLFLIFVILIQSGKGGGLSSLGSASQGLSDSLGATGAEKTLNKLTTGSAVVFVVFAILLSIIGKYTIGGNEDILKRKAATASPSAQQAQPNLPPGARTKGAPGAPGHRPMTMPGNRSMRPGMPMGRAPMGPSGRLPMGPAGRSPMGGPVERPMAPSSARPVAPPHAQPAPAKP